MPKIKKYHKVRDHCHYTGECISAAHSLCNSFPKETSIVFHIRYNYDYLFVIKELVEEFKKQFTCLGKNIEKYIIFSVSIKKEVTKNS